MDKKDKNKTFTSAMDDLKGLLDKEGINISSPKDNSNDSSESPILSPDNIEVSDITEAVNNNLINDFEQSLKLKSSNPPEPEDEESAVDLPILDGTITVTDEKTNESNNLDNYISDMDDDDFDVMEFASSVEELEEKVSAIQEPEHLQDFLEKDSEYVAMQKLKTRLQEKLALEIESSIDQLKNKLLASLNQEIERLFKK